MAIDRDALVEELKFLRKGLAMRHNAVLRRLGPQTRAVAGISATDTAVGARQKLTACIDALLRGHPREVRLTVLAALALHPEADQRSLSQREVWLTSRLNCHERTVRRRVDEAFETFVTAAADRLEERRPADAWEVRSLRAVLRLDLPTPELTEHRTVVMTRDDVRELYVRYSVPRPRVGGSASHGILADVVYGGEIVHGERLSDQHFGFRVALPRPFARGETHEYAMVVQVPPGQPMVPHYVHQPLLRCEEFDVTVRFDPARLPRTVWRLDGVTTRMLDDERPTADVLALDRLGGLHLAFHELRQGLAYGVKWTLAG